MLLEVLSWGVKRRHLGWDSIELTVPAIADAVAPPTAVSWPLSPLQSCHSTKVASQSACRAKWTALLSLSFSLSHSVALINSLCLALWMVLTGQAMFCCHHGSTFLEVQCKKQFFFPLSFCNLFQILLLTSLAMGIHHALPGNDRCVF